MRSVIAVALMTCSLSMAFAQNSAEPNCAQEPPVTDTRNPGVPWPATDALGRSVPDVDGGLRPDRFVGIFYFTWSGHDADPTGPHNVTEILKANPDALKTPTSPPWGPFGSAIHFWSEPLFGYYLESDPWVLRRHASLLVDAGVDTLIFDATNAYTYPDVYMKLCEVFAQIRSEGGRTPQIAFMVNTEAGKTAQQLYDDLYKPGLYRDLWFHWRGKPLMLCNPAKASDELKAFFTLRTAHWPFKLVNTPYAWHWEATYPQPYGYTDDPDVPEQVNVSVAQNLRQSDGKVTDMSSGEARGRSFHDGALDRSSGAVNWGHNAQEQWKRALELDPPFVMVTGWNEWVAGRWESEGKPVVFVDQFDQEFSRDIEMMKGGHGDNYYYQLVANVRQYKGVPALPKASPARTIDLAGPFDQWADVGPEFRDPQGETLPRDFPGVSPSVHYTNTTGRNELLAMKVARDERNLYFYVQTQAPITSHTGRNWMLLLLDVDSNPATGWEGYDYIVNLDVPGPDVTTLQRNVGGWKWEQAAELSYRLEGNQMHVAIPLEALGLKGASDVSVNFKWADNVWPDASGAPGDIMDFYLSGDVAPQGRFMYRYTTGK